MHKYLAALLAGCVVAGGCATTGGAQPAGACCSDPAAFPYLALPEQGLVKVPIDRRSPQFEFQSGPSRFAAFRLPAIATPYQLRVRSLLEPAADGSVFYPVVAILDEAFIVLRLTGLDHLRIEPALATPGGATGLAVTLPVDPASDAGRYAVVFTPAALLGAPPGGRRDSDLLTPATLAWLERRGAGLVPPAAHGRLQVLVAPQAAAADRPAQ